MQIFGAGAVWVTPLTDANGNPIAANARTTVLLGVLQEYGVDESADTKMLYGAGQMPVATARGKTKSSVDVKFASLNMTVMNNVYRGQTVTNGLVAINYDLTGTIVPSTPFTITVTPPSSGTWTRDLGVIDQNGRTMKQIASGTPTTGQYTVSAGAYVFASADVGLLMFISYEYTATSTVAEKSTVLNLQMGSAPYVELNLLSRDPVSGGTRRRRYYYALAENFKSQTKQDDYSIAEIKFSTFANQANFCYEESFSLNT